MASWDKWAPSPEEEDAFLMPPGGGGRIGFYGARRSNGLAGSAQERLELVRDSVVRLYYSRITAVIYFATLVLAGVLLVVTLGLDTPLRDAPGALLALESAVTLSLFLEVLLRALAVGKEYLQSWSNLLDCAFAVASAVLLFWAAPRASQSQDFETQKQDVELSQSLVMARMVVQFGRVLLIAQHARRSRQASCSGDISFSELVANTDLERDLDFSVLRGREWQQKKHRSEDFGL